MLTAVLLILLGVVALLALPVELTIRLSLRETLEKDIRLKWAYGLVNTEIGAGESTESSDDDEDSKSETNDSDRSSVSSWNVFAAIRQKPFRQRIFRFLGDVWRAVKKRDLHLHVRLGLGDPADTGQLWGALGPASGMLANVETANIALEPDFTEETFEFDGSGSLRVIPLQLIYLVAAIIFSPTIWRGVWQMRSSAK